MASVEDSLAALGLTEPRKKLTSVDASMQALGLTEPTTGDRAQAVASGINSGVLTGLLGLPVDTAANLIDLVKSGYGAAKGALGGTELPELTPRQQVVGSSAWIADQMRKRGAGAVIDPPSDDTASKYLHAAGNALGASMLGVRTPQGYNARAAAVKAPNLIAQAVKDAGMAGASGVTAQGAMDATDNPAWAVLGGMAPQAATFGIAAAGRGAARGGEASRQQMADRLLTLKEAGVDNASVGLASGGRGAQSLESFLSRIPGSAGVLAKNANTVADQIGVRAHGLADQSALQRGPETAGQTVRAGIADYRTRQQDIERRLLDRVEQVIPPNQLFPTQGLMAAGAKATAPIPGAPNISAVRDGQRGFVNKMVDAVAQDAPAGLTFEALRNAKSLIGDNAYPAANQLVTDQGTGAAKMLYGGAKQDIQTAAAITDLQRRAQGLPVLATPLMDRANKFYSKTQKILEDVLQPIYKGSEGAPEKAFYSIERGANNAGSLTRQTMLSLPTEARAQVAATVVDRLGKATPGQQNDLGTAFSPQTFLTNWTKITPEAKSSLFMGYKGAASVREGLDSIAAASNMIREKAKVFPNASNTASATAQYSMLGAMGASVMSGQPALMATAFGAPVMAYAGAKLMTSPTFVSWLSKTTTVPDSRIMQHITRLSVNAMAEKDKERRAAMQELAALLREQFDQPKQ